MIAKTAFLKKLLLNRSKSLFNQSFLLNTNSFNSSFSIYSNKINKTLVFYNENRLIKSKNASNQFIFNYKMHSSSKLDPNDPTKAKLSQTSSILADELNKIKTQVQETENETNDQKDSNKKKSRFGAMFSREHSWKFTLGFFSSLIGLGGLYVLVSWGAPALDESKQPIKDQFSEMPLYLQYPKRAIYEVIAYYNAMKEPVNEKLLPDPVPYPYIQPQFTVLIEMTGVLLHPEWTFNTGWRYKKRPGLDYFLDSIAFPMFEVVLFTRETTISATPIVNSLDPQGSKFHFKLFREHTKFYNNSYVKDLSFMNRDPSKIIIIDWDESAYQLQPRNALHRLKKWDGDETDSDLVYLATFLKLISSSGVSDVRDVLDHYNKELNPLDTFKMNQVKLHEAELQRQKELEEKKLSKSKMSSFSLFRK